MHAFFDWWFHQLAGSLPIRLAGGAGARPDAVVLEADSGFIRVMVRQGGAITSAERLSVDQAGQLQGVISALHEQPDRMLIRLQPPHVLQKRLSLPLAAQCELQNALGFEIERETPFAPDEVYWTYALRHRDPAAGTLEVELILVPSESADQLLQIVRDVGLDPSGIEVDCSNGSAAFIPLQGEKRSDWARPGQSLILLAAVAAGLAFLAALVPFGVQQWALASVDATVTSLSSAAREAVSLRQANDQLAATAALLNKSRAENGDALKTLAALTKALPDDSYLTAANLREGRLTLSGRSPSAAELIGQLAQSKEFHEPSFDAPVTRSEDGNFEAFTISVSIATAGAP